MMCRTCSIILCAMVLAALLAGCGTARGQDTPVPSPSPSPSAEPSAPPEPTPEPTPSPTPEPTPTPLPWDLYEFGTPLEETAPVEDDSFFDTAAFLGDSRTEGLQLFSGLKHGDFFWARGMSVFKAVDEEYQPFEIDGEKYSLLGALGRKSYESIYIMIGVNELGFPPEEYEASLAKLIDQVTAAQVDAVVYLQIMPPLNDAMCRQNKLPDYINSANLARFNEAILRMAEEKQVVLLNVAEAYAGADGQLPAELSNDGCHFAYSAYGRWADYLRTHTADRERYFLSRVQAPAQS